ncbi:MAG: hypothetical protein ABSC94_26805 [Polyangiaceae bacterium]
MSRCLDESDRPASQALLSAALGGLLCIATPACSANSASSAGSESGALISGGDTPIPAIACDGGVSADPGVTSTMVVANLTSSEFSTECAAQSGIMEVQPHCGGSNACRGMSYDVETQTLTAHTCRATNSCAGYTCVICD